MRAMKWGVFAVVLAGMLLAFGCGKSDFEQAKALYDKGLYEEALPLLEKAKSGDHSMQAQEMIKQARQKMEEEAERQCVERGENFVKMLADSKTIETWDKIMQELKSFSCRDLDTKPLVDKAYLNFISYLAKWDNYPQAIEKFCEYTDCESEPPHVLIREEDITITDDEGKEQTETIQQEIPIAQHETAKKMFIWLIERDASNARWFDRYAKFLYDNRRRANALDAYETIAGLENIGYEVKSRAKLAADHLKKGGRLGAEEGEGVRYFWIEEVKSKSKLKALVKDLKKAKEEKEQAEKKKEAVEATE